MNTATNAAIGLNVHLKTDYETALSRVLDAISAEGFGVMTEVDVKATLKQKLNLDFRRYKIIGACNPSIAHRALIVEPLVTLLLPCNITVDEVADNEVSVSVLNPHFVGEVLENDDLVSIMEEAYDRLARVIESLGE